MTTETSGEEVWCVTSRFWSSCTVGEPSHKDCLHEWPVTVSPEPAARLNRRQHAAIEPAAIALALIALTALLLRITNAGILFHRPFWVDEWYTVLVASERSPVEVIANLRHGADGGASLYHLIVWGLQALGGSASPETLRLLSLVCMWATLWLVYVILRRRFGPDASIVGVLAAGSHGLVVAHAFEARFYALWLLCCAFVAWSLPTAGNSSRSKRIMLAVASALLVTSHWYGIFTLVVMCLAVVLAHRSPRRDALRALAPALAGVIAFLLILPLASGQRMAITVDSSIPSFGVEQLRGMAAMFWTARVPMSAAVVIVAAWILARVGPGRADAASARSALGDPGIIALLSLAVTPFVLTALSLAGQPSMASRYAIPAVLAWAPLMAFAVSVMGRWPARVIAVVLVGFWFESVTSGTEARLCVGDRAGVANRGERG